MYPDATPRPRLLALTRSIIVAMLIAASAPAATINLPTVTIPFTYTAPSSTINHDFTVPGFDPALGTLTGVRVEMFQTVDSSTLTWTLQNNSAAAIEGFSAYTESGQVRLLRGDTFAQLSQNTGSSSATFGFSLAPGAQTTVSAFGPNGGGAGSLSSANRSYFSSPGNVSLRLQTIGLNLSLADGLSVVSQGGAIQSTATIDIRYTYASSNTTPPPATPIAISSSTSATLSADGEVDWYVFQYATGELTIDTAGSDLEPSNDTVIALYNSTGVVVETSDDEGPGLLSRMTFDDGDLASGTYYLAVAGWGPQTGFGPGFEATSDSDVTGPYLVNLTGTPVPEPVSLALAGVGAVIAIRSRRDR